MYKPRQVLQDFVERLREDAITDDDRVFTNKVEYAARQFLKEIEDAAGR